MTRKDYTLIAVALQNEFETRRRPELTPAEYIACSEVHAVAVELSHALKRDNPHFDRQQFLAVVRGERT
ncbi:hypothetical protein LCGC14_1660460 [marine sediment metagenome]|uniref:Uncharacterized protein n=1 Tax=marine sediment metagenome TaxID=412755 RepID=A0A0F9HU84_9ZZZZ